MSCLAVGINHRESYPAVVRNFCISLNNTSPAAYRLLRNEFDGRIPAVVTLRSWHANADINSSPGILHQSLEILKRKVAEKAINKDLLTGALLFDEMAIRKLLQWSNNQMIGFENIPGKDCKTAQIAKDAVVFMFSSIDDSWQIPVAYYFIASLSGDEKCELLREVIRHILGCGVQLTNITFDGHKTNPAACQILGADLNVYSETFEPSFSVDSSKINIIFDPSHVIKLIRGAVAGGSIYDSENKLIKWIYLERLVRFEGRRNFASMHKMTQAHIDFHSNAMNVKLAVQTLSASTANAIEFLMQQGHSEFKGAEATIKFIRMFNDIFDVFNSTKSSSSLKILLKRKMSEENAQQIFTLFQEATQYIKGLKYRNKSGKLTLLCTSVLKTGFQGSVVNMKSLMEIYEKLVASKQITQIPTHYLSQDHLEVFFGKMRGFNFNGNNRNPTCQQFKATMRKLLANTTIHCSDEMNCRILEQSSVYNPYSNISTITSRRPIKEDIITNQIFTPDDIETVMKELSEIQKVHPNSQLIDLTELTISYIASTIEATIEKSSKYCEFCKDVFRSNEKVNQAFTSQQHTRKACQSTFEICRTADYFLKLELLKGQFDFDLVYHAISSSLNLEKLYPNSSFEHSSNHKIEHIKDILNLYIKYKCTYLAKTVSFGEVEKQIRETLVRFVSNNR